MDKYTQDIGGIDDADDGGLGGGIFENFNLEF